MNSSLLDQLFFLIRLGIDLKLDEKVTAKVVLADDLVRALILLGKSKIIMGNATIFPMISSLHITYTTKSSLEFSNNILFIK